MIIKQLNVRKIIKKKKEERYTFDLLNGLPPHI